MGDLQKRLRGLAKHAVGDWVITEAADRLDALEKQLERTNRRYGSIKRDNERLSTERDAANKRIAELEEGLQFYASEKTYQAEQPYDGNATAFGPGIVPIQHDYGTRARKVLDQS